MGVRIKFIDFAPSCLRYDVTCECSIETVQAQVYYSIESVDKTAKAG